MRVLMLGWEFPPHITGGLGTACYGLTRAMDQLPIEVTFVLPRPVQPDPASPVRVVPTSRPGTYRSPSASPAASAGPRHTPASVSAAISAFATPAAEPVAETATFEHVQFHHLPALMPGTPASAYGAYGHRGPTHHTPGATESHDSPGTPVAQFSALPGHPAVGAPHPPAAPPAPGAVARQAASADMLASCHRYAHLCLQLARDERFDVIHAHDWMTFPAGMAVAAATGKPLVAHVHSTEFDRAGDAIDYRIFNIERRGVHAAVKVIAVSYLTRSVLMNRYDLDPDRIHVVYNAIDHPAARGPADPRAAAIKPSDRIVLFLGRITMQKGPEYFIAAAKRVLAHEDKVKFIVAGAGDKVADVMQLAQREGLADKVLFTGFLDQADIESVFRMASVYVMPSVSEPFGIAALEAIRHDVPVIVSRTAGVSEVIRHTLKVDFWNVDDIADKILAVLRHPSLADTLRRNAEIEVRKLTWHDAARKIRRIYDDAIAAMPR